MNKHIHFRGWIHTLDDPYRQQMGWYDGGVIYNFIKSQTTDDIKRDDRFALNEADIKKLIKAYEAEEKVKEADVNNLKSVLQYMKDNKVKEVVFQVESIN